MLRTVISFIIIFAHCICAFATDFDVIVIGTSPICLLEALYQHHSGNRVLILEGASTCGGAWKSIPVCGVPYAELGCHLIGKNLDVCHFMETYIGCKTVSMDKPDLDANQHLGPNGFYLAGGCRELMDHLLQLLEATNIVLLLNHHMDSVTIDTNQMIAIAHTNGCDFSTSKLIVTPYSQVKIDNHPKMSLESQTTGKTKHHHLYVLIEDASKPRFTYRGGIGNGTSRIMNMTSFVGLEGTGLQLIVFQVQNSNSFQLAETYIDTLKKQALIDPSAYVIKTESFTYEQFQYNQSLIKQLPNGQLIVEMILTHKLQDMANHIKRWKQVFPLYQSVIKGS